MEHSSCTSSGPRSAHTSSSRRVRDSRLAHRHHRSSHQNGSLSPVSRIEFPEYLPRRSDPATRNNDFTDFMFTGVGSQFLPVPRTIFLPKEIRMATTLPLNKHPRTCVSTALPKSQAPASCTRCFDDGHTCVRKDLSLHKPSGKCLRCLLFNYTCKSLAKLAKIPCKEMAPTSVSLRSQLTESTPNPELLVAWLDPQQHVHVDVEHSERSDRRDASVPRHTTHLVSPQKGRNPLPSYGLDVPSFAEMLLELAMQHTSHRERLYPSVEALVNQIPRSQATANGSVFFSNASAGQGSKSYAQKSSDQPSDDDSDFDEDSDDEDNEDPPQLGQGSLEGARQLAISCPLAKNLRYLHDHPECRACLKVRFENMVFLAQHMKVKHHFCCKCCREFKSSSKFRRHIPKDLHCFKCHQKFDSPQEVRQHMSDTRHERDKRLDKEKWDAIWRQFSEEPSPASHYDSTLEDLQLGYYVRYLGDDFRLYMRQCLSDRGIENTATPRELEILDHALGRPIGAPEMSLTAPIALQDTTNPSALPRDWATMSNREVFPPPIPSHEPGPSRPSLSYSQQNSSIPPTEPRYLTQSFHAPNSFHFIESFPSTQQSSSAYPSGMYNPQSYQGQPDSQSQSQPWARQDGDLHSPIPPSMHGGDMYPMMNQQADYTYFAGSSRQHQLASPEFDNIPRSLPSGSTPFTPGSSQDTGPADTPDVHMSEGDMINAHAYHQPVQR